MFCGLPGHRQLGMMTTLDRDLSENPPMPGVDPIALFQVWMDDAVAAGAPMPEQ